MRNDFYHETEYYDERGNLVATRYTDQDMFGNFRTRVWATPVGNPAIPAVLSIAAIISMVFNAIMCALYAHVELIYTLGRILVVFVSVPVMVLIMRRVLRTEQDHPAFHQGRRVQTILTAVTFTLLAVVNWFAMEEGAVLDYGFQVYLAAFVPVLIHSVATMVFLIGTRNCPQAGGNRHLSARAMTCVNVAGFVLIMLAQILGAFRFDYDPSFSGMFWMVGGMVMLAVITALIMAATRIPAVIGSSLVRG